MRWWRAGGCDSGAEGRAGIQAGFKKRFEANSRVPREWQRQCCAFRGAGGFFAFRAQMPVAGQGGRGRLKRKGKARRTCSGTIWHWQLHSIRTRDVIIRLLPSVFYTPLFLIPRAIQRFSGHLSRAALRCCSTRARRSPLPPDDRLAATLSSCCSSPRLSSWQRQNSGWV